MNLTLVDLISNLVIIGLISISMPLTWRKLRAERKKYMSKHLELSKAHSSLKCQLDFKTRMLERSIAQNNKFIEILSVKLTSYEIEGRCTVVKEEPSSLNKEVEKEVANETNRIVNSIVSNRLRGALKE